MTQYLVSDVAKDVRIAMDSNNSSSALISVNDVDTLTLDEIIKSKIEEAAYIITRDAPIYLLETGQNFTDSYVSQTSGTKNWGYTSLPADFLRLVCFQMADWVKPASIIIDEHSPLYAQQKSPFAGIGGNPHEPVVAITQWPIGLVLEFFSCGSTNTAITKAQCARIPKIEADYIQISPKLYKAIIYYTAFLTSATVGDTEEAKNLMDISLSMIKK